MLFPDIVCLQTYVRNDIIEIHQRKGGALIMESILCVDIPVQMISCTDTNGKITPMRFRFRDKTGELIAVTIDKVLSEDQDRNRVGINYSCAATVCGTKKTFTLWYSYFAHEWHISHLHV